MMGRGTATRVTPRMSEEPEAGDLSALVAQALPVILVFGLLAGLWAYLWVSSSPIF